MRNSKQGLNPNTGVEFLLLNVSKDKLTYSGTSYQTRYGAQKNKTSSQIIVRRDLLEEKKAIWTKRAKSKNDRIHYLEGKLYEYAKVPEQASLADSTKDEILRLKRMNSYNFNELKV
jgi:hypothetical protein